MSQPISPEIARALTPRLPAEYCPHTPYVQQAAFLLFSGMEALYGGAAGGGKSDAMLMAALQYVDIPGYRALLLRRTYKDLALPGALMDRAAEWLGPTNARWIDAEKTWRFPSGATITFGFLETEKDKYRYQGAELQFIGFDELAQFLESQYLYLFSRLRKLAGFPIPVRMRAASNPPDTEEGEWVTHRFIDYPEDRIFIPSKASDNPHIDFKEYEKALGKLDVVTRRRLLDGDWHAKREGEFFKRQWFDEHIIYAVPFTVTKAVRVWDFGATQGAGDPTVGTKAVKGKEKPIAVVDVKREKLSPKNVERLVRHTALADGIGVKILIEQEPGASGKAIIEHYQKVVLPEFIVEAVRPDRNKALRAQISAAYAESGNLWILKAPWNEDYIDEHARFTEDEKAHRHDDQVDTTAYAVMELTGSKKTEWVLL